MGDAASVLEASVAPANDEAPAGPAPALPEVLTVVQLAQLLRLSKKTVYEMVQRGDIPGVRLCGRVIRAHRDTVIAWLADGQGSAPRRRKSR